MASDAKSPEDLSDNLRVEEAPPTYSHSFTCQQPPPYAAPSPSSKWSSPRSVFATESGNFKPPSVSSVQTSRQMWPGSVSAVQTSGQLMRASDTSTPKSYMLLSVLNMVCCNIFIGIAAVIFSTDVEVAVKEGDIEKARSYSRTAAILNAIGITFGIILYITMITLQSLGIVSPF